MAKKIEIDIEVNGKMTKATVDVKKLRGQMEGLDGVQEKTKKSGDNFQKGLKGLGEQSANASKNFSKFSAGMGGFVGVYASLAAQLFAVSAAFQFLKRAGDLQTLQAGQVAYASATGIGLRTLTNDIIAATDATVTFQDAAQAAAIGTAAGLSTDQLTKLGGAAKDASIILGRDVTDSFNRLVRGVTKAEPELLDELGVILRLKDATEKYAAELGKSVKDLSAFERSQAVANDVLDQTERKYSRILKVTGGSANAYAQLGKAFDDVTIKLSALADFLVGPLAKVLTETPTLAIAAFGLLLQGPLSALGISFQDIALGAKKSSAAAKANFEAISAQAKKATVDVALLKTQFQDLTKASVLNTTDSPVLKRAAVGAMSKTDVANLKKALKAAEKNYNEHGIVVKGIFKGMAITAVREMGTAFEQISLAEEKKLSRTRVWATKISAAYAGVTAAIKSIGAALATGLTFALRWLGWVGLAVTAYQVFADVIGIGNKNLSHAEKEYKKNREALKELNKELANFAEIQAILAEGQTGRPEAFGAFGAALGQRNIQAAKKDFELLEQARGLDLRNQQLYAQKVREAAQKEGVAGALTAPIEELESKLRGAVFMPKLVESKDEKAAQKYFKTLIDGLDGLEKGTGLSFDAFDDFKEIVKNGGTEKDFLKIRSAALSVSDIIQNMPRKAEEAGTAVRTFVNSLAPQNQAESASALLQSQIDDINNLEKAGTKYTKSVQEVEEIYDNLGNLVDIRPKVEYDFVTGKMEPVMVDVEVAGLSPELVAQRRELKDQKSVIDLINQTKHKGLIRSLQLQTELTKSVQGEDAAQKALRTLKNSGLMIDDKIAAKRDEISSITIAAVKFQKGELTPAQERRLEQLVEEANLLRAQRGEVTQRVAEEEKLVNIKSSLIKLQENNRILNAEKLLLDIANKRLASERKIVDERLKIAKGQSAEKIAAAGVNNLFANTERMQAQENLRLAQEEVALKMPLIQTEYNNKIASIDLEYELLEAKRIQTAFEMQKLAIELEADKKSALAAKANNIASQLIATNYDDSRKAAKDAALATKEASEYGLGKMVRDAQRALQSTEAMNQVLRTAADAFRTAMNDAVNAIFDSLFDKTLDLNEKLKEIGRNFLQAIQQAVTDKLIVSPILEALGLGELGATPSNPMYVQAVGPGLGGGAAASGAIPGLPSIFGAGELGSSESNPLYVKDICGCPEGKPGAGLLDKIMKKEPPKDPLATGNYSSESIDDMINDVAGEAGPFKKLFNTFTDKLGTIFNFDSPFLKGIGNIFGGFKDGLGSVFSNIMGSFGDLFGSFGKLFSTGGAGMGGGLLSGLASMIPGIGPILGGALGIFGFKNGGIMNNGSKVSGYATGGIADGPNSGHLAMLHGREAVVPLPNGNSIPVQMTGNGGMQNNNVTVNVSTDGQVQSSSNGAMGENLGQVIAAAVQRELHNQKRAGGILNKHGAA